MERLECKTINGHPYYYYSNWARVDGKPKRLWQKYLGKLDDIVQAVQTGGKTPACADVFEWGLPEALGRECRRADIAACVDQRCPCRSRGHTLSTGDYIAIAALNRAIRPHSKRSMWQWFSQTALLRHFPHASPKRLTSQRFWDQMHRIQEADILPIWESILKRVLTREGLDLSSICYDGTNYYTFIDTFNKRCDIARRGKNKQGRDSLRQVSFALFCCADGQVPLYFDVYEGNRADAKQFPSLLGKFQQFLKRLGPVASVSKTTLIFDKGNNSADNFRMLDDGEFFFVGSVKLGEHKEFLQVANDDPRFTPCSAGRLPGTKSFRVTKDVYGKERTLVVTYNQNLFNSQWLTVQNDIAKANEKLLAVQHRLRERAQGLIKGGRAPTQASIKAQCAKILGRQHLKKVITFRVTLDGAGANAVLGLQHGIDATALQSLANTYLGKTVLISNRHEWTNEQIIKAYRSQYLIEDVFKASKDRGTGTWWPMHHWTDSKIRVHALYCTIAQLLRALLLRRVRQAGLEISLRRLLAELSGIREVVNIYPPRRGEKAPSTQTVLSRCSALQSQLVKILDLKRDPATS